MKETIMEMGTKEARMAMGTQEATMVMEMKEAIMAMGILEVIMEMGIPVAIMEMGTLETTMGMGALLEIAIIKGHFAPHLGCCQCVLGAMLEAGTAPGLKPHAPCVFEENIKDNINL